MHGPTVTIAIPPVKGTPCSSVLSVPVLGPDGLRTVEVQCEGRHGPGDNHRGGRIVWGDDGGVRVVEIRPRAEGCTISVGYVGEVGAP